MSSRRKKRRAQERRIEKMKERVPFSPWWILLFVVIVVAIGLARTL